MKRWLCLVLAAWIPLAFGCAARQGVPQPKRAWVVEGLPGAVKADGYEIAAVQYRWYGEGFDYSETDVAPILLVFNNNSPEKPQVLALETVGRGFDGDWKPYDVNEATRIIHSSQAFRRGAERTAVGAFVGAAVGAGLGALLGLIGGGGAAVWQGALFGTAIGGVGGGVGGAGGGADLPRRIYDELAHFAWKENPLPAYFTQAGYIYFPTGKGINRLRVTVRTESKVKTYEVGVAPAPEGGDLGPTKR